MMVRWITDNLGTGPFNKISDDKKIKILDVRNFVDKSGNSPELLKKTINNAVSLLQAGNKVVICCDYGISRSNAIAAGVLAVYEGITMNAALKKVRCETGECEIKLEVVEAVRRALKLFEPYEKAANNTEATEDSPIIITGGSGFIGSAVGRSLASQYPLISPNRNEIDLLQDIVELDIIAKEKKARTLIHLAGPRVFNTNVALGESLIMLKNILDICKTNGLKLIYLSTWEVFAGYTDKEILADESTPVFPKGIIGETEYLSEQLIETYYRNWGVPFAIIRTGTVYGKEKPNFICSFIRKALEGSDIVTHHYKNGCPALDMIYIDDVIEALLVILKCNFEGYVHIGSGNVVSTADIARTIVDISGSNSCVLMQQIEERTACLKMNIQKAKELLNWEPKYSLVDGLKQVLKNN